jgi:hypothetical protein
MSGGIGNQLFQYATALNIARKNSFPLLLDISSYSKISPRQFCLNEFINPVSIVSKSLTKTLVEPQNFFLNSLSKFIGWEKLPKIIESKKGYDSFIDNIDFACYLKGSFISYKYFESFNNEFIESLTFNEFSKITAINSLEHLMGKNIICVSIRRGDFLNYKTLNVCGKTYYDRCIEKARLLIKNPTFIFFSDDINWVKNNFVSFDFEFWDIKNYSLNMKLYAMTLCNHYIISNSSYSWWGAWLNTNSNKLVFCPAKVELDDSFPVNDYYLPGWIHVNP